MTPEAKRKHWHLNLKWSIVAFLCVFAMSLTFSTVSALEFGGFQSSKLLVRQGVADSQILLVRTGLNDSYQLLATYPSVSTVSATSATIVGTSGEVDLNGTLDDLNAMPSAQVGFQWGYTASLGTSTTTATMNAIGTYTTHLIGFDPTRKVYYRAVATTDGVNYGIGLTFEVDRLITHFTGLEQTINVTPILVWVGLILFSGFLTFFGVRKVKKDVGGVILIGLAFIPLTLAIFLFPTMLEVIQSLRYLLP